jgi:hypothetical protein
VSSDVQAALLGGISGGVIGGLLGILGALLGVAWERWVRSWGKVLCAIDDWKVNKTVVAASRPDGIDVEERRLQVTFLNRKDVPVTVWDMQVVFYKQDKPLDEGERPRLEFVNESNRTSPLDPVDLPSRKAITQTIRVAPLLPDSVTLDPNRLRAVQEADRVEFVANIVGAKDVSEDLTPWQDLMPWQRKADVVS